jgi:hypothetical protein
MRHQRGIVEDNEREQAKHDEQQKRLRHGAREADRDFLTDKPCPLCGSYRHEACES